MRTSTVEADQLLRSLLSAHLAEHVDAPANYTLVLHTPPAPRRPLHLLYRGYATVARSRSPQRTVNALLRHLTDVGRWDDREHLRLSAFAVVAPSGAAVLAPGGLRTQVARLLPHLRHAGLAIVDETELRLDPRTGELVLEPVSLDVNWGALTRLPGLAAEPERAEPQPAPGRYPVRGLVLPSASAQKAPRSARLVQLVPLVHNAEAVGGQRMLDGLATLLAGAQVVLGPAPEDGRAWAGLFAALATNRA